MLQKNENLIFFNYILLLENYINDENFFKYKDFNYLNNLYLIVSFLKNNKKFFIKIKNLITKKKIYFNYKDKFKKLKFLNKTKLKFRKKFINFFFNKINLQYYNKLYKNYNLNFFNKLLITKKKIEKFLLLFHYKLNKNIKLKYIYLKQIVNLKKNKFYFLNLKNINKNFDDIKINKNNTRLILVNYSKKPYWKLKLSRDIHWKFFKKNTIKKRKYIKYIKFLKKNQYKKYNKDIIFKYINQFFFFFKLKSEIPFFFLNKFIKIKYFKKHILIKLPQFFFNYINWFFFKEKTYQIKKKIKKWSYLRYKKFICPWLQHKKNFQKDLIKLDTNFSLFFINSLYDVSTNCIIIKKNKLLNFKTLNYYMKINNNIKLHAFRYNPD